MAKPLLIVGNKRSGSTQFMQLLNFNSNVFISNESDIIWILFQYFNDLEFKEFKWDDPKGMNNALEVAGMCLDKNKSIKENFEDFQKEIMNKGMLKMPPMEKDNLKYIGDQKPFQNIAPELMPFIVEHFPDAKFIHLVRHPFSVVQSSKNFAGGTGGYIWSGMTEEQLLERWTMHEKWVKEARNKYDIDILDVRYEDIIFKTEKTLKNVFDFLGLVIGSDEFKAMKKSTIKNVKWRKKLSVPNDTLLLMEEYGYSTKNWLLDYKLPAKAAHYFFRMIS
ncbi:MAG: sulfotransferase family protein [bacterium]